MHKCWEFDIKQKCNQKQSLNICRGSRRTQYSLCGYFIKKWHGNIQVKYLEITLLQLGVVLQSILCYFSTGFHPQSAGDDEDDEEHLKATEEAELVLTHTHTHTRPPSFPSDPWCPSDVMHPRRPPNATVLRRLDGAVAHFWGDQFWQRCHCFLCKSFIHQPFMVLVFSHTYFVLKIRPFML